LGPKQSDTVTLWREQSRIFFDGEGNVLDEKPIDPMELSMRKKFQIFVTSWKILSKWSSSPTKVWTFCFLVCATYMILSKRLSLMQAFSNKMNLKLSLVQRFQMKLIYIFSMISSPRGDARGSRKARRRRLQARKRINACVENVSK
jgi:hypothetical protein